MSVAGDHSYFSRFLLKFIEIIAAGLATAVSGYLIAHLSGVLSSPVPAPAATVIHAVPTTSVSVPSQPIPFISVNSNEPRLGPSEVNTPRVVQPTHKTVNTTKAEPARRHSESAINAAESTRERESFLAQVQAALASANANRAEPPLNVSAPQGNGASERAAIAQPELVTDPSNTAVVRRANTGAGETRSPPAQKAASNTLPAVDVNSPPSAAVESLPAPAPAKETGVLSTLEEMLRHDPLAGANEAPRPPMPIGQ
jgi:hypothetical protein